MPPEALSSEEILRLEKLIQKLVDKETDAWDRRDADVLVSLIHPDMVWPWPPDAESHDPVTWVFPMGRFNRTRWKSAWKELFDKHELVHNRRETIRISISKEGDGAFAVVDVDTLWRDHSGKDFQWKGRAGKGYTRIGNEWKLIFHTGLLNYEFPESR